MVCGGTTVLLDSLAIYILFTNNDTLVCHSYLTILMPLLLIQNLFFHNPKKGGRGAN